MQLSELAIKKAKPQEKLYKMADGNGLSLFVYPNSSKLWRYRYKFLGKEKMLSLGSYPQTSLAEARAKLLELKKQVKEQVDPATERVKEKRLAKFNADNCFEAVAKEWHDNNLNKWTAAHAQKIWRRLEQHIFPTLSSRPVAEISTLELLDVLRVVEKDNKTETAHRLLQTCKANQTKTCGSRLLWTNRCYWKITSSYSL